MAQEIILPNGTSEKQKPLQGSVQHQCVSSRNISRSRWLMSALDETLVLDTAPVPSEPEQILLLSLPVIITAVIDVTGMYSTL